MNVVNPSAREHIHDNILLRVIFGSGDSQTKDVGSGERSACNSRSLLESLDEANLEDDSGSIAFVFEKISKLGDGPDECSV